MHYDGEADIRGAYCALSVAKLTNTFSPEIFKDTARWIQRCQTWEGGFGGCPGMEAHGGYALCGLASLVLLGETNLCNLKSLIVSRLQILRKLLLFIITAVSLVPFSNRDKSFKFFLNNIGFIIINPDF